jgi:hypothetical protein
MAKQENEHQIELVFDLSRYNDEAVAAINEARLIAHGEVSAKQYENTDELLAEIWDDA